MKIVLVGAGSRVFGPATVRDILLSEPLKKHEVEIMLMDISSEALAQTEAYTKGLIRKLNRPFTVSTSTDIEAAVDGADFVITAIEIRRYHHWTQDFHIPRMYGFRQIYGENGGPGGLFHALRNMKPSIKIAQTMEKVCPDAWLLNYTNPLTKLCQALTSISRIKTVGLCHGVFAGKKQLSQLMGIPLEEFDAKASGLNHFTWFQSITRKSDGEDLYPFLRTREREAHPLGEWDEIAPKPNTLPNLRSLPLSRDQSYRGIYWVGTGIPR